MSKSMDNWATLVTTFILLAFIMNRLNTGFLSVKSENIYMEIWNNLSVQIENTDIKIWTNLSVTLENTDIEIWTD